MDYKDKLSKLLDETVTTGAVADFTCGTYMPEKGKKKKKRKKKKSPSIFESYNDNYHRQMDRRNRTDGQADETLQFEDAEETRIPGHQVSIEPTEEGTFVLSIEGPTISLAEDFPSKEEAAERLEEVRGSLGERKSDSDTHNRKDAKKSGVEYAKIKVKEFKDTGGDFDQWSEDLLSDALMSPEYSHLLADLDKQSPLGVDTVEAEEAFIDGINYVLSHDKTKAYLGV